MTKIEFLDTKLSFSTVWDLMGALHTSSQPFFNFRAWWPGEYFFPRWPTKSCTKKEKNWWRERGNYWRQGGIWSFWTLDYWRQPYTRLELTLTYLHFRKSKIFPFWKTLSRLKVWILAPKPYLEFQLSRKNGNFYIKIPATKSWIFLF